MPLYGHEMNEAVNPYAAGLGWAVKLGKGDFVGRDAIAAFRDNPGQARVGLELEGKRIARQGAEVLQGGQPVGLVTSGTFSPTLRKGVALALVNSQVTEGAEVSVDVRGRREVFVVTKPPFVTAGVRS